MIMDDITPLLKASAKQSLGVLEVQCPACEHGNQFSEFDAVIIFICNEWGSRLK
jgi:hypothetical protein